MTAFKLDRDSILERLGGDEEIFVMVVDMFLQDIETNCTTLSTALAAGDSAALQREAHTIKGLLATFSDDDGAATAQALENQCRTAGIAGLADDVARLQARVREVAAVLSAL